MNNIEYMLENDARTRKTPKVSLAARFDPSVFAAATSPSGQFNARRVDAIRVSLSSDGSTETQWNDAA